jgi:hypothetical protein
MRILRIRVPNTAQYAPSPEVMVHVLEAL